MFLKSPQLRAAHCINFNIVASKVLVQSETVNRKKFSILTLSIASTLKLKGRKSKYYRNMRRKKLNSSAITNLYIKRGD